MGLTFAKNRGKQVRAHRRGFRLSGNGSALSDIITDMTSPHSRALVLLGLVALAVAGCGSSSSSSTTTSKTTSTSSQSAAANRAKANSAQTAVGA